MASDTSFHDSVAPAPVSGDALIAASETVHIVCCRHPETTLCGLDASDADIDDDEDNCVVCGELFDDSPEFCPRRPFCPEFSVPA